MVKCLLLYYHFTKASSGYGRFHVFGHNGRTWLYFYIQMQVPGTAVFMFLAMTAVLGPTTTHKSKFWVRPFSRFWPYRPYLALFPPTKATWTSQNYAIIRIATLRSRNPTAPRNSENRPREKIVFPQHGGN